MSHIDTQPSEYTRLLVNRVEAVEVAPVAREEHTLTLGQRLRTWRFWANRILDIMALLSIAGIGIEIFVAAHQYDDVDFCNPIDTRAECQAEVFRTCDWSDIDQLDGSYCFSDARTATYYFIVALFGILIMLLLALLGSRAAPFLMFKQKARWAAVRLIFTFKSTRVLLAGFLQLSEGILLYISSSQYERFYYVVCDLYSDGDSCEADALEQFCAWDDDAGTCNPIIDVPFIAVNIFHYVSIILISLSYLWVLAIGYSLFFTAPVLLVCCCCCAKRRGCCERCHPRLERIFWRLFACSSFSRIYNGLCIHVLHPASDHHMVASPRTARLYEIFTGVILQGSILVATCWMYIKIGFVGEESAWVLLFVLASSMVGFVKGIIGIFYEEEEDEDELDEHKTRELEAAHGHSSDA